MASKTIALIDSSKFGRSSLLSVARAERLDALIVDSGIDPEVAAEFRAAGVNLEIAPVG